MALLYLQEHLKDLLTICMGYKIDLSLNLLIAVLILPLFFNQFEFSKHQSKYKEFFSIPQYNFLSFDFGINSQLCQCKLSK